jgi:precorrin-2 dehydrogenase/sirohydrochlorin ferrochelatase
MPEYFPVLLDLRGRRCLVAGGGDVAERKARALLECGAEVLVVSPVATPGIVALARAGALTHRARAVRTSDVRGCDVVIAATGVEAVDTAVAAAARRRRALVNVVDRAEACDFIFPSVLRRGELTIAVSTGGRSPALAREIRRRLEPMFGPEHAALVERVGDARRLARAVAETPAARIAAGEQVLTAALAQLETGGFPFAAGVPATGSAALAGRTAVTGGIAVADSGGPIALAGDASPNGSPAARALTRPRHRPAATVRRVERPDGLPVQPHDDRVAAPARRFVRAVVSLADRLLAMQPGLVHRELVCQLERALLAHMLDRTAGNQLRAARLLGVNRNTLRKRCRQLGVPTRRGAGPRARQPTPA